MKTILRVAAMSMALAFAYATATAGDGCGSSAAKMAKDGASCASKCSGQMAKEGCASGEAIALGGAEDAGKAAKTGFGLGHRIPEGITLKHAVTGEKTPLLRPDAKATVLIFWNQECPYIVEVDGRVAKFAEEMKDKGVHVVAVDAGVNNKPESVKEYAAKRPFPVLLNEDSMLAVDFNATRTPEVFVIDGNGVVQYHGAFDGGARAPERTFTADAVKAILDGKTPEVTQTRAFGCTIKWSKEAAERREKMAKEQGAGDQRAAARGNM